jgi:hypothetical protein
MKKLRKIILKEVCDKAASAMKYFNDFHTTAE